MQNGLHYSKMLPIEYQPSLEYLDVFHKTLEKSALKIACAIAKMSETILKNRGKKGIWICHTRISRFYLAGQKSPLDGEGK
jgi:hypothetical protein